jgi:hypothetical protein
MIYTRKCRLNQTYLGNIPRMVVTHTHTHTQTITLLLLLEHVLFVIYLSFYNYYLVLKYIQHLHFTYGFLRFLTLCQKWQKYHSLDLWEFYVKKIVHQFNP